MKESSKRSWLATTAIFMAGTLVGAGTAVQVAPKATTSTLVAGGVLPSESTAPGFDDPGLDVDGPDVQKPSSVPSDGVDEPAPTGLACERGRNGGATDTGVSADRIRLATTTVQSGIGAAFLGEVKFAIEAVKNKVNRAGGICGRLIEVTYVDDGWDPARGAQYLRNFIKEGYFAIAVGPSSEGLQLVIKNGDIDNAGIPVVGADGMVIDQYKSPWVWPVAVATASSARIMARNAYARGARDFSIVFDKNYRFGAEAADAYNAEVRRLTGEPVNGYNPDHGCRASFCGVQAGQSGYATEVNQFEPGDFVAMFLEPQTALTWMSTAGVPQPSTVDFGIDAAQPMFTRDFATNCQSACHGMRIWTGYRPADRSSPYASEQAVRTYVNDLKTTKPDADESNAFTEGGYVGMTLLVEALAKVGPFLTRQRLRTVLDQMTYRSGLAIRPSLSWSPDDRYANTTMQAFTIQYKGTFSGWQQGPIERDPTPWRGIG